MISAKHGKKDARIQYRDDAETKENFIDLQSHLKGISMLVTSGLTIFLAWKDQYLFALIGACLTLAAATSDRLKRIRIGRQGFHGEWQASRKPKRS